MPIFALSDPVELAIIGVFQAIVVGAIGIIMFMLREKADRQREERANKRLSGIEETGQANMELGQKTHDLANSAMLAQKKMLAVSTKAHADNTLTIKDRAIADAAEVAYQEHLAGQTLSDAKEVAAAKIKAAEKVIEKRDTVRPL